jgi:hypothetical protein
VGRTNLRNPSSWDVRQKKSIDSLETDTLSTCRQIRYYYGPLIADYRKFCGVFGPWRIGLFLPSGTLADRRPGEAHPLDVGEAAVARYFKIEVRRRLRTDGNCVGFIGTLFQGLDCFCCRKHEQFDLMASAARRPEGFVRSNRREGAQTRDAPSGLEVLWEALGRQ